MSGADSVQPIRVDAIIVRERLRSIREDVVTELSASIQQIGLINPITICRPNGRLVPYLVSGAHRLEVARRLGWESIPCCTVAGDDADTTVLMEIDENLARGDLSPAERAIHVAKRKEIYERQHPETKQGGAQGAGRGRGKIQRSQVGIFVSPPAPKRGGFTTETAAKTGNSKTSIARDSTRAKHIPQIAACVGTSLDHGDELDALAKLTPAQQAPIIERAATGKKTSAKPAAKSVVRAQRELDMAGATRKASATLGSTLYSVIYADPPWRFEPRSRETGLDRAADNHYQTVTVADICKLVPPAAKDCALFLWATAPMLREALSVLDAWGFTYKSHFVWSKDRVGTGYWVRNRHELLLIATKGSVPAPAPGEQFISVVEANVGEHSEKPFVFAEMIEEMFPTARPLEMFARGGPRAGWDVWGNEAEAA